MDEVSLIIRRVKRGGGRCLDLSGRDLATIPNEVFQLKLMEELVLANNSISALPDAIAELTSLQALDLSGNRITRLPQEIVQCMALRELKLAGNPIGLGNLAEGQLRPALENYFQSTPSAASAPVRVMRPNSSSGGRSIPRAEEARAPATARQLGAPAIREVTFSDISLGSVISQGGFSVVHRATWKGATVAVKVIVDPVITPDLRNEFDNEVAMLNYLRHPGTVLLMGVCSTPPKLAVVTEFADGGSLFDLLHKTRRDFPMDDRVEILKKVANVMLFYHESGVVHRDLKSMNVLLDRYLNVKMCDFGLARFKVSTTQADLNTGTMQFSGTPSYMAPELFKKQAYDGAVDVYAFGTLVWEVVTRQVPFDGIDPADIRDRTLRGAARLEVSTTLPRKYAALIEACRGQEPAGRPTFAEVLNSLS